VPWHFWYENDCAAPRCAYLFSLCVYPFPLQCRIKSKKKTKQQLIIAGLTRQKSKCQDAANKITTKTK
jgi:hypothetical protein